MENASRTARLSLAAACILGGLLACSSAETPRTHTPPDSTGDTGGAVGTGGSPPTRTGTGGTPMIDAAPAADSAPEVDAAPADAGLDLAADLGASLDLAPDVKGDRPATADTAPDTQYDPCPPKGKACVVLPLGDSLTQGAGSSDSAGYRGELFRQVVTHNQMITMVGSAASGPAMLSGVSVPFPRRHEGHGGFSIGAIGTWLTDNDTIATYKPDIVLLHIGTNNGLRHPGANIPAVLDALGKLIDQIVAADSHLLLIVAQIIPSTSDDGVTQTAAYNAGIPAVVAARASAGKHVIVADIHKFFVADPNWKTDYLPTSDVHPIDAGYQAMGKGWYSALGPLLR